jgi:hypothetical protein
MMTDHTVKLLLFTIALFLGIIALGPVFQPGPARAQMSDDVWYFEPGTAMLRAPAGTRQVVGKVAVNLRTGDVWGFPTLTSAPYPVDSTTEVPPVSKPIYLGKFDLSSAKR